MSLLNRLSNLFRRRDINREIDEELEFHIEARVADNRAAGMSADEARRDALLRLGGVAATREETRDADIVVALDTLKMDLSIAARSLRRRPGFPAIVIATLALGIGAATTIFTVVESLLLRPLPFAEPERIYSPSHRLRHALIVAEVGLALVLLIGAGLLGRSFLKLQGIDPGFRADAVMTMTASLPTTRYATAPRLIEFHDRVLSSLQAQPGVSAAGLVNWLPFGTMTMRGDISAEGGQPLPPRFLPVKAGISADYFKAMGLRLQEGRTFSPRDRAGSERVAVISATVARTIWPGGQPLGRRISTETNPGPQDWLIVVGVVDDVKQNGLKAQAGPAIYLPYSQITRLGWLGSVTYVARATSGRAESLAPAMRNALKSVDPEQAPESLATMSDLVGTTIAEPRFQAKLIGAFSVMSVVLAAVGIYGVLAASVFERRREIGIRMALGAARSTVVGMMLKRALLLALAGVAGGAAAAYGLTGILRRFLFGVTPTDALTFVWASAVLLAVALLAGLLPARRASRLDPITTLRGD